MTHPFRPLFVEVRGIPPRTSHRMTFARCMYFAHMFKSSYAPMTAHQLRAPLMGGKT